MNSLRQAKKIDIHAQIELQKVMRDAVKIKRNDGSVLCVFSQKWFAENMSTKLENIGIVEKPGTKKIVAQDLKDDNDWLTCNLGWCVTLTSDNLKNLRIKFDRTPSGEEKANAKAFADDLTAFLPKQGQSPKYNLQSYGGRLTQFTLKDLAIALDMYAKSGNASAEFIPSISGGIDKPLPISVLEIFHEALDPHKLHGLATIIASMEEQKCDLDILLILKNIEAFLKANFLET